MKNPVVVRRYAFPTKTGGVLRLEMGETLTVDDGICTVEMTIEEADTYLSCGPSSVAVTRDPVDALAKTVEVGADDADRVFRGWVSRRIGVKDNQAREELLRRQVPALAEFSRRFPTSPTPSSLSNRMFEALRQGPDPRQIVRSFLADPLADADDGRAFARSLDGGSVIGFCDARAWLMALVPPGSRSALVNVPIVRVGITPPAAIASITQGLRRQAAVDFALAAAKDRRAALSLTAATQLGLVATGSDGVTAYQRLLDDVMASDLAAPVSGVDAAIHHGVLGLPARRIASLRRAREVAEATGLCVAAPEHGWLTRMLRGEIDMVALGPDDGVSAVIAVSRGEVPQILEARKPGNGPVPPEVLHEFSRLIGVTE